MKKLMFILFLLIINFYLLYCKISSIDIKNVKVKLKNDEVGIILLYLENSTNLLIQKDDYSLLYVLEYTSDDDLYETINLFTKKVDYVFMRDEYDLKYSYKVVVDGSILIDSIIIEKYRIRYNNHTFCIDTVKDCTYIYLTKEIEGVNAKLVLYNDSLSNPFVDRLYDNWADIYKVTKNAYVVLILGKDYELVKIK